jgi:hypothetical protein
MTAVPRVVINIAGKEVDITNIPPLTMGDKIHFKKALGIDLSNLAACSPEQEVMFCEFVLKKLDPEITVKDVQALPLAVAAVVFEHVGKRTAAGADRPT